MTQQPETRRPAAAQVRPVAIVLRWVGVALVACAVAAGPLLFGSVESWAWAILLLLAAAASLMAMLVWIKEGCGTIVASPLLALLVFLCLLAAFQLVPLPGRFFAIASERTAAARGSLALDRLAPISLAPGVTLEALLKLIAIVAASFATLALVRTRAMIFLLVAAAAFAMVVSSAVGVMQEGPEKEKIYWARELPEGIGERPWRSFRLDPSLSSGVSRFDATGVEGPAFFARSSHVGDVFGSYANSNHFGGLVEIVLPVLLALTVALLTTRRAGWGEEGGFASTPEGGLVLMMGFAVLLGVGAVIYARSAGALAGIVFGFTVVLALMAAAPKTSRTASVLLAIMLLSCVGGGIVFRAQLSERMLGKIQQRIEVWEDATLAVRDFPVTGSGLGTYRFVAPHYEDTEAKYLFAHNDYLQFAMEGGLVAAGIAALLVIWQFVSLVRGAFAREEIYMSAVCAGAAGSMAAIGLHSFFDFNLHVPGNAMLLAVIVSAGAVAARAQREDIETISFRTRRCLTNRTKALYGAAFAVIVLAAAGLATASVVMAESAKAEARVLLAETALDQAPDAARISRISRKLERAARFARWDAELRYRFSQILFEQAGTAVDEVSAQALRADSLRAASAAFALAPSCTFYAMSAVTLGAEGREVLERWQVSSFSYKRRLAEMMFEEGRVEDGLAVMREAFELEAQDAAITPRRAVGAVAELVRRFGSYERIRAAAPDSLGGRFLFAAGLAAAGLDGAAEEEYLSAARLAQGAVTSDGFNEPVVLMLALRLVSRERTAEAMELYHKTLERRPGWHYLRLDYARQLARQGSTAAADKEIDAILAGKASRELLRNALELRESLDND